MNAKVISGKLARARMYKNGRHIKFIRGWSLPSLVNGVVMNLWLMELCRRGIIQDAGLCHYPVETIGDKEFYKITDEITVVIEYKDEE